MDYLQCAIACLCWVDAWSHTTPSAGQRKGSALTWPQVGTARPAARSGVGTQCPFPHQPPLGNDMRHENIQQFWLLCKVHYIKFICNDNINANIALQWFPRYTVSYHINIVWHSYNGHCFRRHTKPTASVNYFWKWYLGFHVNLWKGIIVRWLLQFWWWIGHNS